MQARMRRTIMDCYDTFYGRERGDHHGQMLDLIVNYGYLTPARVARDERHRRLLHDAALGRLPRSAVGTDWLSPLLYEIRVMISSAAFALTAAKRAPGRHPEGT